MIGNRAIWGGPRRVLRLAAVPAMPIVHVGMMGTAPAGTSIRTSPGHTPSHNVERRVVDPRLMGMKTAAGKNKGYFDSGRRAGAADCAAYRAGDHALGGVVVMEEKNPTHNPNGVRLNWAAIAGRHGGEIGGLGMTPQPGGSGGPWYGPMMYDTDADGRTWASGWEHGWDEYARDVAVGEAADGTLLIAGMEGPHANDATLAGTVVHYTLGDAYPYAVAGSTVVGGIAGYLFGGPLAVVLGFVGGNVAGRLGARQAQKMAAAAPGANAPTE